MIKKNKDIVLLGGGDFSSEVAEVAILNSFNVVGYIDKTPTKSGLTYLGTDKDFFNEKHNIKYLFPSYGAVNRSGLIKRADSLSKLITNFKIPSLVSKHAYVSESIRLGKGVFISHGAIVNPNVVIGDFCIINSNTTIGHDVKIENNTIISGNVFIGGQTSIGHTSLIGPGANIMNSINIGSRVIISIGSTVARSIKSGKTTVPNLSKSV